MTRQVVWLNTPNHRYVTKIAVTGASLRAEAVNSMVQLRNYVLSLSIRFSLRLFCSSRSFCFRFPRFSLSPSVHSNVNVARCSLDFSLAPR